MKIGIFIAKNEGARANVNRALALKEEWADAEVIIAKTTQELKGCDLILNQILDRAAMIEEQRRFIGYGKQVILFIGNTVDYQKKHHLLKELLVLYDADLVCHSPNHYDSVREYLKMMAPSEQRGLLKRLHYIPGGVTDPGLGTPKRENWCVPFNRLNQTQKRISEHVDLSMKSTALLAMKGLAINEHLMLVRAEDELEGSKLDLSGYNIETSPKGVQAYYDRTASTGMFLSTSIYESFGVMPLELLLRGAVGVFVDYPWVRRLLPDYPFVATKDKVPEMMASVYRAYDKAHAHVVKTTVPFIRETYNFKNFAKNLRTLMEEANRGQ